MRFVCLLFALSVPAQAQSGTTPATTAPSECAEYASKLDSCSPYTCTFTHPFTGAAMQRTIIGLDSGNCVTTEAMPGKHEMKCALPPAARKAVAAFFRETQAAEAAGKTVTGTLSGTNGGKPASTTTVAGKPVANPLQQALENGICKIGG